MKKYQLQQRFPNFFSGFVPIETEFDTIEELQQVGFVKRWMENPDFLRLRVGRKESKSNQHILMVDMKDGTFWAIGWLKNAQDLEI